jgi:UDP-N-acetylglucosamine 2-epimerase (non-hydrolysing)
MHKILVVFGTRPEAIKMAPVVHELRKYSKLVEFRVCVTGQHREMLDQVLNLFEIEPDYDLHTMKEDQSLFDITVEGLRKLEDVLKREGPDLVLVQGDTTTTFIASLAAYYLKIRIGHVEAGLRTKNKFNPFPEEINRRLTDCLADLYFVPTVKAKNNLLREGIDKERIFITGNTVVDALLMAVEKQKDERVQRKFEKKFLNDYGISLDNRKLILVTGHRRESFGKGFEDICKGLKKIAQYNNDVQIIYPVHLNPNVQKPVRKILGEVKNVHLIEPLDYFSFVWLMNRSNLILTDSGGIQEEAPSLGKPVLVMRKTTERPEGVEAGVAKLVGTDDERIFSETMRLLANERLYKSMSKKLNPYGDGHAAEQIVKIILEKLSNGKI